MLGPNKRQRIHGDDAGNDVNVRRNAANLLQLLELPRCRTQLPARTTAASTSGTQIPAMREEPSSSSSDGFGSAGAQLRQLMADHTARRQRAAQDSIDAAAAAVHVGGDVGAAAEPVEANVGAAGVPVAADVGAAAVPVEADVRAPAGRPAAILRQVVSPDMVGPDVLPEHIPAIIGHSIGTWLSIKFFLPANVVSLATNFASYADSGFYTTGDDAQEAAPAACDLGS